MTHEPVRGSEDTRPPPGLPEIPAGPPLLVVISGQSGSGKDSVRDLLMAWRLPLHFAVTATTRARRPDEVDGVDYRFVSEEEFHRLEREGKLIETALVYGQHKGVPKSELMGPLAAGRDVLARVDVQGAATLRQILPDALLIYIEPPSQEEAGRRLDERDTETDAEMATRLAAAARENEAAAHFDYRVVNETGKLEKTARRIVEIIASEKGKRAEVTKRTGP